MYNFFLICSRELWLYMNNAMAPMLAQDHYYSRLNIRVVNGSFTVKFWTEELTL